MARSTDDNLQNVNFRITTEELARIDNFAQKYDLTRSQVLRNFILVSLDEAEAMEKFGLLRAAITVRDIVEWMGDKAKNPPVDQDEK